MFSYRLTDNAELRPLLMRHAQEMLELINRERDRLHHWMNWVNLTKSVEDVEGWLRASIDRSAKEGYPIAVGIFVDGKIEGTAGFVNMDFLAMRCEIGYWISAAYEGKGLISRAFRGLVDHAFNDLRMNRVEIRCDPENQRSAAVALRLNFVEEGILRESYAHGESFRDQRILSLLRREWEKLNTSQ